MYEFTPVGWLKHCVFHPVEGFEDLRWKKQGSIKISMIIVLFLFIAMVVDRQLTGFQFNESLILLLNILLTIRNLFLPLEITIFACLGAIK